MLACSWHYMVIKAVNIAGNAQYKKVAFTYFIPGALVCLLEHLLVATNNFHF